MRLRPDSDEVRVREPMFLSRRDRQVTVETPRVLDILSKQWHESISLFEAARNQLLLEALTDAKGIQKHAAMILRVTPGTVTMQCKRLGMRDLSAMLRGRQ